MGETFGVTAPSHARNQVGLNIDSTYEHVWTHWTHWYGTVSPRGLQYMHACCTQDLCGPRENRQCYRVGVVFATYRTQDNVEFELGTKPRAVRAASAVAGAATCIQLHRHGPS